MLENLTSQILIVEIFGPRQLRNACFEAAFDRLPDDIICSSIAIACQQSLSITQSFLGQILQVCPIHQQAQDTIFRKTATKSQYL
jgi:hypothetical protein